jgi:hypothetical protein
MYVFMYVCANALAGFLLPRNRVHIHVYTYARMDDCPCKHVPEISDYVHKYMPKFVWKLLAYMYMHTHIQTCTNSRVFPGIYNT